jgi:hypothetical protein
LGEEVNRLFTVFCGEKSCIFDALGKEILKIPQKKKVRLLDCSFTDRRIAMPKYQYSLGTQNIRGANIGKNIN